MTKQYDRQIDRKRDRKTVRKTERKTDKKIIDRQTKIQCKSRKIKQFNLHF